MSDPRPGPAAPASGAAAPALIAEATKRAGLIWITVPGGPPPRAAWHVWLDGAAYVLTGPGEQQVPGLQSARQVSVSVPSKDTGGLLLTWTADVTRVDPAAPGWDRVAAALVAGRLNPPPGPEPPAARWAATGLVCRLAPAGAAFDPGPGCS